MAISTIESEREKDIRESIVAIRQDMLAIDKKLGAMIDSWRDDYSVTRKELAGIRMVFTKDIRTVDKLDASVFYEEKIEAVGFRPKTLGSNRKDIVKSSSNSFVQRILRGEANVVDIAKETRP